MPTGGNRRWDQCAVDQGTGTFRHVRGLERCTWRGFECYLVRFEHLLFEPSQPYSWPGKCVHHRCHGNFDGKYTLTRAYGEVSTGTRRRGTKNMQICKDSHFWYFFLVLFLNFYQNLGQNRQKTIVRNSDCQGPRLTWKFWVWTTP